MTQRKFVYSLGALLVFLIAIFAWYGYHQGVTSSATTATSTNSSAEDFKPKGIPGAIIKDASTLKAPEYTKPLSFSAPSISSEVRSALEAQFSATVSLIEKNPTDFYAWLNLGQLRKLAGDFQGAAEDWAYISKIYPTSNVPFDNLGELYLDFLKDYTKAEANFETAIRNDPHDINAYQQLFSLYTIYGYKAGTSAAANLIEQGLKDNPGNQTLLELKAQLSAS